ncbi:hypothetical protein [Saccharopolyspora aridisoli]|nr:hypothetical protein [Saccharopolyspora aridisoli]
MINLMPAGVLLDRTSGEGDGNRPRSASERVIEQHVTERMNRGEAVLEA